MESKRLEFLELHTRVYELGLLLRKEGRTLFTEDDIRRKHRYHYKSDIPFEDHGFASLTDFLLFSDRHFKQVILDPSLEKSHNFVSLLKENYMLKYKVPPNADSIPRLITLEDDPPEEPPPPRLLKPKVEPPAYSSPSSDRVKSEPPDPYPGEAASASNSSIYPPSALGNQAIVVDDDPRLPSPVTVKQEIDDIPPPRSPSPEPDEYGPEMPQGDEELEEAPEDFSAAKPLMDLVLDPVPLSLEKKAKKYVERKSILSTAAIKKDISRSIRDCLKKAEWITVDEVRTAYIERYKTPFDEDCALIGCTTMERLAVALQGEVDIYQNEFQQWICKTPEQVNSEHGRTEVKNFLFSFRDGRSRSPSRDEKRKESQKNKKDKKNKREKKKSRSRSPSHWVHDKFEDKSPSPARERKRKSRDESWRSNENRRRDRSHEVRRSRERSPLPRTRASSIGPRRFDLSKFPKRLSPPSSDINGKWKHDKFEEDKNMPPPLPSYTQHDDRFRNTRKRRDSHSRRENDANKEKKIKKDDSKKRKWTPPLDANGKWDKTSMKPSFTERQSNNSKKKYKEEKENGLGANHIPLGETRRGSFSSMQDQEKPKGSVVSQQDRPESAASHHGQWSSTNSSISSRPTSRLDGEVGNRGSGGGESRCENDANEEIIVKKDGSRKSSSLPSSDWDSKKIKCEEDGLGTNYTPLGETLHGSFSSMQQKYKSVVIPKPNGSSTDYRRKAGADEPRGKVRKKEEVAAAWKADPGIAAKEAFYKFFPKWKESKKPKKADDVDLWDEAVASKSGR